MSNNGFGLFKKRNLRLPPALVLVLGLVLTGIATYFAFSFKASESKSKINEIALRVSTAIDERLRSYGQVLLNTRSFVLTSAPITRETFSNYVMGLDLETRYPGILGVGFAQLVEKHELKQFQKEVQKIGPQDYQVWPRSTSSSTTTPVVYFAPMQGTNYQALGFDMGSDSARRAAMQLACDTGQPTLSGRLSYLAEDQRNRLPGFLLFVPVYSSNVEPKTITERRVSLIGFIYGPFRGRDLLAEIAKEQREYVKGVNFEVYDGSDLEPGSLLYAGGSFLSEPRDAYLRKVIHKTVNNREWTVVVQASQMSLFGPHLPIYFWFFVLGVITSLVIYLYARTASAYARSLEKSESMLSLVTNSIPALVGYVDRDHRYRFNNKAFEAVWGLTPAELRGKKMFEVMGRSYSRFYKPLLERALKGEHITFEHSHDMGHLGDSGSEVRHFRGEYIPDMGADGRANGVIILVNDQTEQKLFQEKLKDEQRISELVNEVGLSLQTELNPERLAQKITDVATELMGAEAGAFTFNLKRDGTRLITTSGPLKEQVAEEEESTERFTDTFLDDHIVRLDDFSAQMDMKQCWGSVVIRSYLAAPVISRSGDTIGGLLFIHTKPNMFTVRAEKLIGGIAAQAAVALDNAKLFSESQGINRVKDEFLATLSHELRTPMNVILGYSELLKEEDVSPMVHSYADAIYRNAKAQNQLIADLLDISAIITGKLAFTPIPLVCSEIVRGAIENLRFAAESKHIELLETVPLKTGPIIGDPTRVQQIVWNLLSNAIKFTPDYGKVAVSVKIKNHRCEIQVIDSGIGIDAEFIPYIFERFSQEDSSRSRRFGGLGLGLSIVRQLVELHGGQIHVDSEGKNLGSCFTVSLPLAEQAVELNSTFLH